jgi:endo-1,4-beta-mannosidase
MWMRDFDKYVQMFQESNKPIILEEFGLSTYPGNTTNVNAQAAYYQRIFEECNKHQLAGIMAWCLWDYSVPLWNLLETQYGLLHTDGSWKPAAFVFHAYATGESIQAFNFDTEGQF